MNPLNVSPQDILNEARDFNEKFSHGLTNMLEVGEIPAGVTPREAVYEEDKLVLYRYLSDDSDQNETPLLIVYALVNRPYMTDLQENRSTVKGLLDAGQDVYLIDWGYPDRSDRYLGLEDYIDGYIRRQAR